MLLDWKMDPISQLIFALRNPQALIRNGGGFFFKVIA